MISSDLIELILERCQELGQEAFSIHQDLEKWRETPLTAAQRCAMDIKINTIVSLQYRWLSALKEEVTKDEGR